MATPIACPLITEPPQQGGLLVTLLFYVDKTSFVSFGMRYGETAATIDTVPELPAADQFG